MKKIKTLFKRDFSNKGKIYDEYAEGTEWVVNGEGTATRKYDGTSVLIRDGRMYKRHEVKDGKQAPDNFEPVETDPETGKTMGWVPVGEGPEDQWHREVTDGLFINVPVDDGTYELIGPKIQGNPEGVSGHILIKHTDALVYDNVPTSFEGLKNWLEDKDIEGIVWHHTDGRMVKIKKKDFRLKR